MRQEIAAMSYHESMKVSETMKASETGDCGNVLQRVNESETMKKSETGDLSLIHI